MSLITGVLLFLLVTFVGRVYLNSYESTKAILDQAKNYLSWMRFTLLILPMQNLMSEMVYCDGDEKISMLANVIQYTGNLITSILLSRVYGVRGISFASFVFTTLSFLILCVHLLKKDNSLRMNLFFSWKILGRVLRYSVMDASSYLFISLLTVTLNILVTRRFGPGALVLVTAISIIREFQFIFDGVGAAITPVMGVYLGEKSVSGVRNIYRLARKVSVLEGIVVTLVLIAFSFFVPDLLGVREPDMKRAVTLGVALISLGSVFTGAQYLDTSYYLLLGRIRLGLMITLCRDLLLAVPLAVLPGIAFGVYGLLAGLALSPFVAWLLFRIWLRRRYGDDAPLLLKHYAGEREALLYSLNVKDDEIIRTRDRIGQDMKDSGWDELSVHRVMLLLEESLERIRERNGTAEIQAECALRMDEDRLQVIIRDNGVPFDLSDPDPDLSSLRAYVASLVMDRVSSRKQHLVTMSFNRSMFEICGECSALSDSAGHPST